jgi:hypothetical protein
MNTLLRVTPGQVESLIGTPERAVDLVRDLLWAEARRQGVNPLRISVSDKIYSKDGGVDGTTIEISPKEEGLLFQGVTYYQIKWGKTFDPRKDTHLREELISNDNLKPKLKELAEKEGTYVLVWFGGKFKSNEDKICTEAIKTIFDDRGYSKVKVFVIDVEKIAQLCSLHPVIQSTYFNQLTEYFLTVDQWMERFVDSRNQGSQKEETSYINQDDLKALQNAVLTPPYKPIQLISQDDKGQHQNRLLVYEVLKNDGLKQKAICVDADDFSSPLSTTMESRSDLNQIIVVDNCEEKYHQKLIDILGQRTSRLALIVISTDNISINDERFCLVGRRGLSDSTFLKEIASKKAEDVIVPNSQISTTSIPEQESLDLPNSINTTYDMIIQHQGHEVLNLTKRVLGFMALFSKIGSEINITPELKFLSQKIGFVEPHDWLRFVEVIHLLREHRIIQGQYYLKISDEKFRQFLIQEWWNIYGSSLDFKSFLKDIYIFSEDLAQRLIDSVPYITATAKGKRVAQALLGESGMFSSGDLLKDEFGSQLFGKLTEADPATALYCLKKSVGTWSKEELLQFTTGRREVVWALEKIAMWRDLFSDAARLLLALGEAENETWSNNASGVFAELFSSGYGKVAPTEASPQERLPILKETLESSSKERRLLALRACDQALESQHFVRTIGEEQQGLRKEPQLWLPKTYGELFDAYRQVWKLLCEQLDRLSGDEQQQAIDILLRRARGLGRIQNLADIIIDTVNELAKKSSVDKKKVLAEVVEILHYEGKELPLQTRQRWEQLKDELAGSDFSSLMMRYVGMDLWADKFDEKGNRVDQTQPRIEELARQAVENNDLLQPELEWLVTTEAQNGYLFGYELGKRDKDFSLLPILLEAQRNAGVNASVYFLGGYFRALFEKNQVRWEKQLEALTEDEKLTVWIPELTWRSGMSDRAALRVLDLAKKGIIGIGHFRMFGLGSVIRNLSEDIFKKWIEFLLGGSETYAVSIALDLYHFYYVYKDSKHTLPENLTLKLLTHQLLLQKSETGKRDQMDDYHWAEIGKAFVRFYPKKSLELADKMLEHFGEDGTILEDFHSQTQAVLNEITRRYPQEVWKWVIKYLGPPIDSRAFDIKEWLRGGEWFETKEGILPIIPLEKIWEWVDEDVEGRARYLASFVPKTLFRTEGKICLAREVLVRYGHREDVRGNLMANFSREGWTGLASLHFQAKKQKLFDFKGREDNENVKRWIDEYVASLDQQIEWARIGEERRGF